MSVDSVPSRVRERDTGPGVPRGPGREGPEKSKASQVETRGRLGNPKSQVKASKVPNVLKVQARKVQVPGPSSRPSSKSRVSLFPSSWCLGSWFLVPSCLVSPCCPGSGSWFPDVPVFLGPWFLCPCVLGSKSKSRSVRSSSQVQVQVQSVPAPEFQVQVQVESSSVCLVCPVLVLVWSCSVLSCPEGNVKGAISIPIVLS